MQRWGLNEEGKLVQAEDAESQKDYLCPECSEILRVKKGAIRHVHFFHVKDRGECRLRARSTMHLKIQEYLKEKLQDCTLEYPFQEIGRIADVAYHPLKVVFEIQISPISKEEAVQRTKDYWSLGWHVVWLLHVDYYGKRQAKPVEEALIGIPHYFIDLGYREGSIFDEISYVSQGKRVWVSYEKRDVKVENIKVLRTPGEEVFVERKNILQGRKKSWSCHFEGDFFDVEPREFHEDKKEYLPQVKVFFKLLWAHLLRKA
jgi:hypothetical protein